MQRPKTAVHLSVAQKQPSRVESLGWPVSWEALWGTIGRGQFPQCCVDCLRAGSWIASGQDLEGALDGPGPRQLSQICRAIKEARAFFHMLGYVVKSI